MTIRSLSSALLGAVLAFTLALPIAAQAQKVKLATTMGDIAFPSAVSTQRGGAVCATANGAMPTSRTRRVPRVRTNLDVVILRLANSGFTGWIILQCRVARLAWRQAFQPAEITPVS